MRRRETVNTIEEREHTRGQGHAGEHEDRPWRRRSRCELEPCWSSCLHLRLLVVSWSLDGCMMATKLTSRSQRGHSMANWSSGRCMATPWPIDHPSIATSSSLHHDVTVTFSLLHHRPPSPSLHHHLIIPSTSPHPVLLLVTSSTLHHQFIAIPSPTPH